MGDENTKLALTKYLFTKFLNTLCSFVSLTPGILEDIELKDTSRDTSIDASDIVDNETKDGLANPFTIFCSTVLPSGCNNIYTKNQE